MPEETSTGKIIFPIRPSKSMKKEGWFTRPTNTNGISVRLATLKVNDETVVQAYIFDTKKGWTMASAKKWLKGKDIEWIAALTDNDDFKGQCLGIEVIKMVISGDDAPRLNTHHTPGEKKKIKKKKMVRSPKKRDKRNGGGGHKTCSVRTPK